MKMAKVVPEHVLKCFASRLFSSWSSESGECAAPAASKLTCFLSSCTNKREAVVTLPSLELTPARSYINSLGKEDSSSSSSPDSAAKNLGRPKHFNKIDICNAPSLLLCNISSSFQSMLDDTLFRAVDSIIRKSAMQMKDSRHDFLLKLLLPSGSTRSAVHVIAATSTWITLPPKIERSILAKKCGRSTSVLPIIFLLVLDVDIIGMGTVSLALRVPGTISAQFAQITPRLELVEVIIDSDELHASMTNKCKSLVKKTVGIVNATYNAAKELGKLKMRDATKEVTADQEIMPPPLPRMPQSALKRKRQIDPTQKITQARDCKISRHSLVIL